MTLKERFKRFFLAYELKPISEFLSNESAKIAEEFAIGFAEWLNGLDINDEVLQKHISTKELLEIYKKEKGL